jgi:hypothetical protein
MQELLNVFETRCICYMRNSEVCSGDEREEHDEPEERECEEEIDPDGADEEYEARNGPVVVSPGSDMGKWRTYIVTL